MCWTIFRIVSGDFALPGFCFPRWSFGDLFCFNKVVRRRILPYLMQCIPKKAFWHTTYIFDDVFIRYLNCLSCNRVFAGVPIVVSRGLRRCTSSNDISDERYASCVFFVSNDRNRSYLLLRSPTTIRSKHLQRQLNQ